MNNSTWPDQAAAPADPDLAARALPGHGIPSQDPDPAAQVPLTPAEADREAQSVMSGGGMVGGAAIGAGIGTAVAGPVGVLVGGSLGAMAGALGGAAAGGVGSTETQAAGSAVPADAPRLHIDDSGGKGRPVVLIHGWPLSTLVWQPQFLALREAGYRVVAYDRRGFGRSDQPASGYDDDTLADDLQRVIDQCGLQDVTLVGFSMGGGEVARYVARHGESRLRSVVFAAAVTPCLMQSARCPGCKCIDQTFPKRRFYGPATSRRCSSRSRSTYLAASACVRGLLSGRPPGVREDLRGTALSSVRDGTNLNTTMRRPPGLKLDASAGSR